MKDFSDELSGLIKHSESKNIMRLQPLMFAT